jgi:predicted phosphodiesterase
MLAILGDIHGNFKRLPFLVAEAVEKGASAVIQVGDFGVHRDTVPKLKAMNLAIPLYFIDGNHEDFRIIAEWSKDIPTEVAPNAFYVPRGCVLELDGRKIGFCGGAASVDKEYRVKNDLYHGGKSWFAEEEVLDSDIAKFDSVDSLDILITHVAPQIIIKRNMDPMNLLFFGLPISWVDPSAEHIQRVWERLGRPLSISGHLHQRIRDMNCMVLDIDELIYI